LRLIQKPHTINTAIFVANDGAGVLFVVAVRAVVVYRVGRVVHPWNTAHRSIAVFVGTAKDTTLIIGTLDIALGSAGKDAGSISVILLSPLVAATNKLTITKVVAITLQEWIESRHVLVTKPSVGLRTQALVGSNK
jgi:hypothetical protein